MLVASEQAPRPGKSGDAGTRVSRRNGSLEPMSGWMRHSAAKAQRTKCNRLACLERRARPPRPGIPHQNGFPFPLEGNILGGFCVLR